MDRQGLSLLHQVVMITAEGAQADDGGAFWVCGACEGARERGRGVHHWLRVGKP